MKFSHLLKIDLPFFENKQLNERFYWFLLFIVIGLILAIRYRLLDFPLERDEGEYAYMGQLILQGIPPYEFAYNMKLPGTYLMYAIILKFFGETTRGIHTALLLINITTVILIFLFVKKLFNSFVGLTSAAAYGIYSLNPLVLGFAAHATHFVLFWSLLGIYLLLDATENDKKNEYFWVGLFLGLGFLMKQQAVFLILFAGIYFLYITYYEFKKGYFNVGSFLKRSSLLVLGVFLPFLLTVLILGYYGVLPNFWYWTVKYASKYAGMSTFYEGLKNFSEVTSYMGYGYKMLWILVFVGFLLHFFIIINTKKKVFLTLLFIFSFLTTTPGLHFRSHYFIVFLPFAFIYFGIAIEFFRVLALKWFNVYLATILACILFIIVFRITVHKDYYFKSSPLNLSHIVYANDPFPEAIKISEYIKMNTSVEDRIAVLGSEPEIYFYSNRKSATGYIYMYPPMEIHPYNLEMQENFIKEINLSKPKYIVYVNTKIYGSWGFKDKSEMLLLNWFEKYKKEQYELVGISEMISFDESIYKWENEAKEYLPKSGNFIEIFKRRN